MRLYVDDVGRVRGVAEYSLTIPGFLFVAAVIVHVKASEANLRGVFLIRLFRKRLEQGLLGLATRTTLTGKCGHIDDPEVIYKFF